MKASSLATPESQCEYLERFLNHIRSTEFQHELPMLGGLPLVENACDERHMLMEDNPPLYVFGECEEPLTLTSRGFFPSFEKGARPAGGQIREHHSMESRALSVVRGPSFADTTVTTWMIRPHDVLFVRIEVCISRTDMRAAAQLGKSARAKATSVTLHPYRSAHGFCASIGWWSPTQIIDRVEDLIREYT
jgi:hypothetical protein